MALGLCGIFNLRKSDDVALVRCVIFNLHSDDVAHPFFFHSSVYTNFLYYTYFLSDHILHA